MKCKSIINNFVIVLNTCIPNIKTIGVNNTEYLCVNNFKYFIDFNEKILKNVRHKFYYFSIFFFNKSFDTGIDGDDCTQFKIMQCRSFKPFYE